jgi:hypothetical protein
MLAARFRKSILAGEIGSVYFVPTNNDEIALQDSFQTVFLSFGKDKAV